MERKSITVSDGEIKSQLEFCGKIALEFQSAGKIKMPKYRIITYGCQLNENDSEKLAGLLIQCGYTEAAAEESADIVVFNTCAVRENAETKVYGNIGAYKAEKGKNPDMVIAVAGCMTGQPQAIEKIKTKYRFVDIAVGTHDLYRFPQHLYNVLQNRKRILADDCLNDGNIAENLPIKRNSSITASVTVMYGCNNFCSYCIVPYVRGRERSRTPNDIVNEVQTLVTEGYKDITLLGQNVNSYGRDTNDTSFSDLLKKIDAIEGEYRLRFMTSHPKDMSDDLIEAMVNSKHLARHLHLPFQSGSTAVLNAMNRVYTREDYIVLADKIRKSMPDITFTSDVIVGFPGESESDFEKTLSLVERLRFDMLFTYLYSRRGGTPAALLPEIEESVKKRRFDRLVEMQNKISAEINLQYRGKIVTVLTEGLSKTDSGMMSGRMANSKVVNFSSGNVDPSELIGKFTEVIIETAQTWSFNGKLNI